MPRIDLTDTEYEAVLAMRERDEKPRGYCEDYPCCGHTPDDPCTRQWYDTAAGRQHMMRHSMCDHDAGYCEMDEYDDEED
jgi:hypothetical protein